MCGFETVDREAGRETSLSRSALILEELARRGTKLRRWLAGRSRQSKRWPPKPKRRRWPPPRAIRPPLVLPWIFRTWPPSWPPVDPTREPSGSQRGGATSPSGWDDEPLAHADDAIDREPIVDSGQDQDANQDDGADPDEETTRGGLHAAIGSWTRLVLPRDLDAVPAAPGIYIVMTGPTRAGYVGLSTDLRRRWRDRLRGFAPTAAKAAIWFGVLGHRSPGIGVTEALRGLEHAIVRLLSGENASSRARLTNRSSIARFRVGAGRGPFRVANVLPPVLVPGARLNAQLDGVRFDSRSATLTIAPGAMSPEAEAMRVAFEG